MSTATREPVQPGELGVQEPPDDAKPRLEYTGLTSYRLASTGTLGLAPGQALPVWGVRKHALLNPYAFRLRAAVVEDGMLVTVGDGDMPDIGALDALIASGDYDTDPATAEAASEELASPGAVITVRPGALAAIGLPCFRLRAATGKPQIEVGAQTALQFARMARMLEAREGPLPVPIWVTPDDSGPHELWDVSQQCITRFRRLMLPFSLRTDVGVARVVSGLTPLAYAAAVLRALECDGVGTVFLAMAGDPLDRRLSEAEAMGRGGVHWLQPVPDDESHLVAQLSGPACAMIRGIVEDGGLVPVPPEAGALSVDETLGGV